MLRFFRTLRRKLLEEGRVRTYFWYAIGEVFLVVIGILIALQVNNWNQNRIDKNAAVDFEARLLEDIYEEKALLESVSKYQSTVKKYALYAMEVLESGELNDNDGSDFLISLYQASQLQYPTTATSTYQELLSAGKIGIIADDSLRSGIITYYNYDWVNSAIFVDVIPYRENIRNLIPNSIQSSIREECGDIYTKVRKSLQVQLPDNCELTFDEALTRQTVTEILANESITKDLRFKIATLDSRLRVMSNYQNELDSIIRQFTEGDD